MLAYRNSNIESRIWDMKSINSSLESTLNQEIGVLAIQNESSLEARNCNISNSK